MDIVVLDHLATPLWVPVLVAPDTPYNGRVPLILGTIVIGKLKVGKSDGIWTSARRVSQMSVLSTAVNNL